MTSRRSIAIYGMLFVIWAGLIAWQVLEHVRVEKAIQAAFMEKARYAATTCARLLRSSRRRGVVAKEFWEEAVVSLVKPSETNSINIQAVVIVNRSGEIVASAPTNAVPPHEALQGSPDWDAPIVWLANVVDLLGTNVTEDLPIAPFEQINAMRSNEPPQNITNGTTPGNLAGTTPITNLTGTGTVPATGLRGRGNGRGGGGGNLARPSWMTDEEYKSLSERMGAHNFFIGMSTQPVHDAERADLWIRLIIALLGTAGVVGYAIAWQGMITSSDLQVRLVRASEMNLHLKEMNLAAAGLAHETRNPLNIIRGLAQIISKQQDASTEVRTKTRDIIDETDRVTAQLNEFINYSRPREVRRAPTDLSAVVGEVARTLNYDIEEKNIQLQIVMEPLMIEADEQLLRQAIFNLVLNAVQAVGLKGEIRIRASKRNNEEAFLDIADDGPGVPQANRAEIFKPYFTTHPEGTGLGLSVVQQIVQAHGWDIQCLPNQPTGALFRIAHIKLCGKD